MGRGVVRDCGIVAKHHDRICIAVGGMVEDIITTIATFDNHYSRDRSRAGNGNRVAILTAMHFNQWTRQRALH